MTTKDRLYAWLNAGTFNEKDGCRHPIDVLAAALGVTERTVIRATKQLEDEGRIRVHRPKRRGQCNTYWVDVWTPSKRSGVLNVLRAVKPSVDAKRDRRQNPTCHPKRTAVLSRAHTRSRPVLSSPQSHCQHAARERATPNREGFVKGCPDCLQAAELNERLATDLAAQQGIARREALRAMAAERRLSDMREDDPDAEQIRGILETWKRLTGHKRARCPANGKRWTLVKRALRHHTEAEVIEAIEGIAAFPYVGPKGRMPHSSGKRYDDIEYALKDEVQIQKARELRWRVDRAPFEAIWDMWDRSRATEGVYWQEVLKRLHQEEQARSEYRRILEESVDSPEAVAA